MGRKEGFRHKPTPGLCVGLEPGSLCGSSSAQLSPDSRPGNARQWHCGMCRCQQPHCQRARPVLGQGATSCKDLSLIRHPWFTLVTALPTLSGVCVESKCHLTQYDTISSSNFNVEDNPVKGCGFPCTQWRVHAGVGKYVRS